MHSKESENNVSYNTLSLSYGLRKLRGVSFYCTYLKKRPFHWHSAPSFWLTLNNLHWCSSLLSFVCWVVFPSDEVRKNPDDELCDLITLYFNGEWMEFCFFHSSWNCFNRLHAECHVQTGKRVSSQVLMAVWTDGNIYGLLRKFANLASFFFFFFIVGILFNINIKML